VACEGLKAAREGLEAAKSMAEFKEFEPKEP